MSGQVDDNVDNQLDNFKHHGQGYAQKEGEGAPQGIEESQEVVHLRLFNQPAVHCFKVHVELEQVGLSILLQYLVDRRRFLGSIARLVSLLSFLGSIASRNVFVLETISFLGNRLGKKKYYDT